MGYLWRPATRSMHRRLHGPALRKLGQNCYDLIQEGGGKEQACSKEISKLTPANEKKAQDEGLANVDLKVGGFFACAFSCGTCPKTCEDDPDSLIKNNCEADPSKCDGVVDCKGAVDKYGCDTLLTKISEKVPDIGLTVSDACPKTCNASPKAGRDSSAYTADATSAPAT